MYGKGISLKYCNKHSKSSNVLIFRREDVFEQKKYCDMIVRCMNEIHFFCKTLLIVSLFVVFMKFIQQK